MNRFRTKKKAKEEAAAPPRSSSEDQPSSSFFRRNKKAPEEEKKDLDLTSALPSTDEFRTSLLMTGLSARFSMLREQDDPNTKIGKASDDSVLFPKRQSRLMELGFRGLDDIAEVESIRAPPPLARAGSYNSDSDSAQGSIMNRTRPGEGNILFGGRQKIYRIPAGSGSGGGGGMTGRALYEDDVALSAFQKFKLTEKNRLDTLSLDDDDDNSGSQRASPDTSLDVPPVSTSLSVNDSYDSSSPSPFLRSDSPSPTGYNLRRETSSTTSSGARNSTAATSVVSQPAASSAKDWQLPSLGVSGLGLGSGSVASASSPASATSATGAPTLDRAGTTSTRSRRLYEQGLTQDMHEHQSSALSRIDTLSGKRTLGSRTPDFNQPSSPTALSDRLDRFGSIHSATSDHRRPMMLAKASAPNLRSISPPTSDRPSASATPSLLPADIATLKTRTSFADAKAVFSGTPPLSPPMSDSGDHPLLPIQPGDRGKATAMGVFQKPSLPYDESRFAQRQLQMQQGRETPTRRFRAESNASHATGLSSRSSSAARQPAPTSVPASSAPGTASQPVSQRNSSTEATVDASSSSRAKTFLFDDDDEEESAAPVPVPAFLASIAPAVTLQRPSDMDHPAFRQTVAASEVAEDVSAEPSADKDSPVDSPTLGPNTGLSGLVKQHLRSISNASSVYSTMSPPANDFPDHTSGSQNDLGMFQSLDVNLSKPWNGDRDWMSSAMGSGRAGEAQKAPTESKPGPAPTNALPPMPRRREHREVPESARSSDDFSKTGDEDDFASQLANARRRVQERLTTYVESDTSRNTSPQLAPTEPALPLPPKSNPLGILRGKSSRGSLMERSRDVSQPNKALKLLGIGPATSSTAPSSSKQSFEDVAPPMPSMSLAAANVSSIPAVVNTQPLVEREALVSQPEKQERRDYRETSAPVTAPPPVPVSVPQAAPVETVGAASAGAATVAESDVDTDKDDDVNVHPGLRAFRNARRQLQKRKELETLARHGDAATTDGPGAPGQQQAEKLQQSPPSARERRGVQQSTPVRDRKPPPVYYQQRDHSEESQRPDGRQSSQTERDRSGSDSSNGSGGRTRQVPEKLRIRQDEYHVQQQQQQQGVAGNQHLGAPRYGAGAQLRSPGLPGTDIRRSPYQPPQAYAAAAGNNSNGSPSLRIGNGYDSYSAQPSPISPIGNGGAGLPAPAFYSGGGAGSANGSAATTPTSMGPRMQQQQRVPLTIPQAGSVHTTSTLNDSLKRTVNKNDISEPTFLMSTSRVPTVSLPQNVSAPDAADGNGSRSRSGSRSRAGSNAVAAGYAPPLPPINPLRSKQSGSRGPRGMISGLMGRRNEHDEGDQSVAASDDEGSRPSPRVLRKPASDAGGMRSRMGSKGQQRMDLPGGMI